MSGGHRRRRRRRRAGHATGPRRASRRRPAGLDLHAAGDHGRAGADVAGNARLSPIANGRVACMHTESGAIASVSVRDRRHQRAVGREPGGRLRGRRPGSLDRRHAGGDYVIAAPVSDTTPPAGGAPQHGHPGGVTPGEELTPECTLETWTGVQRLDIHLDHTHGRRVGRIGPGCDSHEVCTSSHPHPDAPAELPRSYASAGSTVVDTFCYNGAGAGERFSTGTSGHLHQLLRRRRLPALHRQRRLRSPGAKRPATQPAAPGISTRGRQCWRPVNLISTSPTRRRRSRARR